MTLKARQPEQLQKRLKLFLYGHAGVGKSTCAIQFPRAYVIDAERGVENYADLIRKSQSAVYQTVDADEVLDEIRKLRTEEHEFRTLVIDPITPIYTDLLDKAEQQVGNEFGRHYGEANKTMKRLVNVLMALDMNVIVTAHAKTEYGNNFVKLGETFDGWKKLDYIFDLVLELNKRGKERIARVRKSRLQTFPDGQEFPWSYETFVERYGEIVCKQAQPVALATPEQVAELQHLIGTVKLPEGTVRNWLRKANAADLFELNHDQAQKCIDRIKAKLS